MAIEWTPILVAAATGLGTGIVGSLFAPWANWRIERTREQIKARRELIKNCRQNLASGMPSREFRETPEYSQICCHLSRPLKEMIEKDGTDLCPSDLQNNGIPFMTTSLTATVVESEERPHLNGVAN